MFKFNLYSISAYTILSYLDFCLTRIGISMGYFVEANPIVKSYLNKPMGRFLHQSIVFLCMILILVWFDKLSPKLQKFVEIALGIIIIIGLLLVLYQATILMLSPGEILIPVEVDYVTC
jgi:hypothetical protein